MDALDGVLSSFPLYWAVREKEVLEEFLHLGQRLFSLYCKNRANILC